jgi:hypothetical protein
MLLNIPLAIRQQILLVTFEKAIRTDIETNLYSVPKINPPYVTLIAPQIDKYAIKLSKVHPQLAGELGFVAEGARKSLRSRFEAISKIALQIISKRKWGPVPLTDFNIQRYIKSGRTLVSVKDVSKVLRYKQERQSLGLVNY